jgi:hypothetical protein
MLCLKQLQLKHEGQNLVSIHACLKQLQLKHEVQNLVSIHNFSQLVISLSSETKLFILTGYVVLGFVNVKFYSHY